MNKQLRSGAWVKTYCPPHEFERNPDTERDECHRCGLSWRDWTRGFGSNVNPKRVVR